ncbi:MAG TPA: hypothetical protein VGB70_03810 [Allosphingosinicella sp.]|jgi:hypothetical protein
MSLPPIHHAPGHNPEWRSRGKTPEAQAGNGSFGDLFAALGGTTGKAASFLGVEVVEGAASPTGGAQHVAAIFNEKGLLHGLTPAASTQAVSAPPASDSLVAEGAARNPIVSEGSKVAATHDVPPLNIALPADNGSVPPSSGRGGPALLAHAPLRIIGSGHHSLRLPAVRPEPALPLADQQAPATEGAEAAAPGRSGSSRIKKLLQNYLARMGASSAQVSVQAGEEGLTVATRLDRIGREERDRLRAAIAQLLAGHGMAAARILVNGAGRGDGRS